MVKLTAVVILTGPAVFYKLVWIPLKNPILTFDLFENMLSDIVLLFLVCIGKKGIKKIILGCSMDDIKKFSRNFAGNLLKIKWTDFWGQNLTFISTKRLKIFKLLLSRMLLLQMYV